MHFYACIVIFTPRIYELFNYQLLTFLIGRNCICGNAYAVYGHVRIFFIFIKTLVTLYPLVIMYAS